jgi:hypothetical protein
MEVLQRRFQAIFTAADVDQLERASQRLHESVSQSSTLPIVPINRAVAKQFAGLLRNKKLKLRRRRGSFIVVTEWHGADAT